jgi:hypothetical protein
LHRLATLGFASVDAHENWSLTPLGQQAQQTGTFPQQGQERRVFHFVEPSAPLRFLALREHLRHPWPAGEEWRFDVAALESCVRQSEEWKRRHSFPLDVHALARSPDGDGDDWQRIVIDHPERLTAALALSADAEGREQCLGFEVRQGWSLQAEQPVFQLGVAWREIVPELAEAIPIDQWRQSWHGWLQSRGLDSAEIAGESLEHQDAVLRVRVADAAAESLRSAIQHFARGDLWLVAGTGRFRPAARVELLSVPSPR